MKKIILIIALLFCLSGCTTLNDMNYDDILGYLSTEASKPNVYRTGYKYHLPYGLQVDDNTLFNEVLISENNIYYLYVDGISYFDKINMQYNVCKDCYYSKSITNGDKFGYVEINLLENEKYLIEIMYNYAKIEVIVDKDDINSCLFNAINILKSIEINDGVINNLLESDMLNFTEEEFNIFNTTSSDSTYIPRDNTYVEEEDVVPDPDLIN